MWGLAAVLALAACGRIGFEESRPPAELAVVQTPGMLVANGATAKLPLAPTGTGNMLVVVTSDIEDDAGRVVSVSDDAGNDYVPADVTFSHAGIAFAELWYAVDSKPGATLLTVEAPLDMRETWLLELTGADARAEAAVIMDAPQLAMSASPPLTVERAPAIVIAYMQPSTSVDALAAGSPFIALDRLFGDEVAYQIVSSPGTYSAVWLTPVVDTYSAGTVAFTAAR